jgi:beta-lactamase class C
MPRILICILILLLLSPRLIFADNLSEPIKQLTQQIGHLIKTKKIPGCAIAIVDHDKIVYMNAFGVRKIVKGQKGEPINLDTVFQLGSLSKSITATLVAILQKNGALDIDQPAKIHLPWINPTTTTRHILNHTSGFVRTGWNNKIEANTPRITLVRDLSAHPQSTPGETFDYHNLAFSLLEDIIMHATKSPFENLLQRHIFTPLGMTSASCGYPLFSRTENKAWPHQITKKGALVASSSLSRFYHAHVPSAGGMNANIRDMANFLLLQLNGQSNLISTEDLAAFHTPTTATKDALAWFKNEEAGTEVSAWYGLGWRIIDIDHHRIVYHGGWLKGFKNFMAFLPDRKIGIVILHNSEGNFSKKEAIRFLRNIG